MVIRWFKYLNADVSSLHLIDHNFMVQRSKHSGDESDTPYTKSDANSDTKSDANSDESDTPYTPYTNSDAMDDRYAELSYLVEDLSFEITESLVVKKDIIRISPLAGYETQELGYETQELAQELDLSIQDLQTFCKNNNEGSLHHSTDLNINASIDHKSSNIIELILKISDSPISDISSNSASLEAKIARLRSLSTRLEILSWGRPLKGWSLLD
jgi:hypothetical protein